jgi:hypothetical protein
VVDLVLELARAPEPRLRSSVAAALAWVKGPEAARAHAALLDLLADPAPSVRCAVATLVAHVPGAHVPRLLDALRAETDVTAAYALVTAILRLDPEGGRARVESLAAARPLVEQALRLREAR